TQNRTVQGHGHQPADHRARPSTGDPGGPARARSGGEGQASSGGDHGSNLRARHDAQRPGDVGSTCHPPVMQTGWGRPAAEPSAGWAVLDVETSGFRPGSARVISLALLALDAGGQVEHSVVSLLNPGVDPGPTHVHGLTAAMLEDQPQFADIVGDVAELLRGRTLVAHNVAFDYAFLTTEAEMADVELPIDTVMCTVELARRLELGIDNLRLETLAAHWGVTQRRPHDAFDDAIVLTDVLAAALDRARERE